MKHFLNKQLPDERAEQAIHIAKEAKETADEALEVARHAEQESQYASDRSWWLLLIAAMAMLLAIYVILE